MVLGYPRARVVWAVYRVPAVHLLGVGEASVHH